MTSTAPRQPITTLPDSAPHGSAPDSRPTGRIEPAGRAHRLRTVTAPQRDARRRAAQPGSRSALWLRLLALALVTIAFVLPRWEDLDRMVTPDEPIWLARSANFYEALASRDWPSTYQYAHPGVPVMWAGAIGYFLAARDYPDQVGMQITQRQNYIASVLEQAGYDPLDVLVATRQVLIVFAAIAFALAFWYALRLLGLAEALLGFLLIGLEPYGIGLGKLLHVDAIAALFFLLAMVTMLVFIHRGRCKRDLLVCGVASALAILTRAQTAVLIPIFGLLLLIALTNGKLRRPTWAELKDRLVWPLAVWGVAMLATAVVLWPALSTAPRTVISGMFSFAETAAIEGHEKVIYFDGELFTGDPGYRFYPVAFLWRATPATLAGLILAVALVCFGRRWALDRTQRQIVLGLLIGAGSYTLLMTLAAKKFDRYLMPAFPLVALAAGWAILQGARLIGRRLPGPSYAYPLLAATLAVGIQLSGIAQSGPYYLSYYSPLMGGTVNATDSMMVGWGEGFDQVADYLNAQPDAGDIVVSTEAWRSPLSYFLEGDARFAAFVDDPGGLFRWATSDYYLLYVTPLTRNGVWPDLLKLIEQKTPVLTVTLNGLDYARLYDIRDDPIPAYLENGDTGMIDITGAGRLVASGRNKEDSIVRGATIRETLSFDRLDAGLDRLGASVGIRMRVVDAQGDVVWHSAGPLRLQAPIRHGLWWVDQPIQIPPDTLPGSHRVEMQLYDLATGAPLPAFSNRLGERMGAWLTIDTFYIYETNIDLNEASE
jgi:hypothetical protein